MGADRWQKIERIFHAALQVDASRRPALWQTLARVTNPFAERLNRF